MSKKKNGKRVSGDPRKRAAEARAIFLETKQGDVHDNMSPEAYIGHRMYKKLMKDNSISKADKEQLTKSFIVARACSGEMVTIPKKYMEDVALGWDELGKDASTRAEKDGCKANAQFFRTMVKTLGDGGQFVQQGW